MLPLGDDAPAKSESGDSSLTMLFIRVVLLEMFCCRRIRQKLAMHHGTSEFLRIRLHSADAYAAINCIST